MHIVEILLPLADNEGQPFPPDAWKAVREELVERFGGITAFTRSPAEGLWEGEEGERSRDEIVVLEVMAETLERGWWRGFREELEARFRQDEIVIRASAAERL